MKYNKSIELLLSSAAKQSRTIEALEKRVEYLECVIRKTTFNEQLAKELAEIKSDDGFIKGGWESTTNEGDTYTKKNELGETIESGEIIKFRKVKTSEREPDAGKYFTFIYSDSDGELYVSGTLWREQYQIALFNRNGIDEAQGTINMTKAPEY